MTHYSANDQGRYARISEPFSTGSTQVVGRCVLGRSPGAFVGLLHHDPGKVYCAARACVLAPQAICDPMRAVELAKEAQLSRPELPWYLHALGMAHFRAGQLEEAEQRFQESLTDPNWKARFLNWLGLALVRYRRGETEEARQWLGKAVELMERDPGHTTQDRLEGQLLRREVERLLGKPEEESDAAGVNRKGNTTGKS